MGQKSAKFTNSQAGKILIDEANEQLIASDANNIPRILLGLLPDGSYGLVISKPGINVFDVFSA